MLQVVAQDDKEGLHVNNFIKRLKLIRGMAYNDIKTKYANSILGIMWAFLMPLAIVFVFWYVFELGLKNPPINEFPYILWFIVAYVPWIFFSDLVTNGCQSMLEYSYLVKKMKFNLEDIAIIKLCSAMFVHGFFVVFLLIIFRVNGFCFRINYVQCIYYSLAAGVWGTALSYLLSAITVFFKDMVSVVNIGMQIMFWVTPILWNEENLMNNSVRTIVKFNPMYYVVNGYRQSFIYEGYFWEKPGEMLVFWCVTIIFFIFAKCVFNRLSPFFVDEV